MKIKSYYNSIVQKNDEKDMKTVSYTECHKIDIQNFFEFQKHRFTWENVLCRKIFLAAIDNKFIF